MANLNAWPWRSGPDEVLSPERREAMVVPDRLEDLAERSVLLQDGRFGGTCALILPLSRSGRE